MEPKFRIGDSKVLESRETVDGTMIRRRRESTDGRRFTTYERIEMPQLTVTKRSGNKEIFDRDKLLLAVKRSVGKFFGSELEIEEVVTALKSGWITTGPRTKLLERRLAAYIETGKTDVDTECDVERWSNRVVV